ncbi:3-carboxymuconate cyclase [Paenibacillus yonginensis]|uniref:3-carboxymuconate cyclase n=1 Tax=Paenibacillus yonginensis TaxID=1462996 RepID=A0A1B1MXQ3_9BACL|nr:lactonase family protein [Paenibacillus yonginensis]ANS73927.1 3-carboxymuconate cyclase [Paenibacillus yonginensis]
MANSNPNLYLFIGSYAEADGPGVYVYKFNESTGELAQIQEISGLKNPTFLNVDPSAHKLYSIAETVNAEGKKAGEAVAFSIDPATGRLAELNRNINMDNTLCHIQRVDEFGYAFVSSYHGGKVGAVKLNEDGTVGKLTDEKHHEPLEGQPADAVSHVHSAFFSPDKKYLLVNDLGLDLIRTYKFDAASGTLTFHGDTRTAQGAGPRHLAFHPSKPYVFVIHELNSTIVSYRYEAESGALTEIQSVSTLPAGFEGSNGTAEIAVSKDGRFVYGSNRGHDSIVIMAVDQATGELSVVDYVSTEGGHPRHFALTPSGDYLIAANRDGNNLVVFSVNKETGLIQATGVTAAVSKPVCVQPFYL